VQELLEVKEGIGKEFRCTPCYHHVIIILFSANQSKDSPNQSALVLSLIRRD
jgi:hypothetical protein